MTRPNHHAGVTAIDARIARMMAESHASQMDFAQRADAELAAQRAAFTQPEQREAT